MHLSSFDVVAMHQSWIQLNDLEPIGTLCRGLALNDGAND